MDKKSGGGLYVRPLRKNTSILSIEVFFCMKEFKAIDEQIEILKDRGLIFKDTNMACRYLLTNNYYNIINGYGKYFQVSADTFIKGTRFDEVRNLYFFDKQLKQTFFNSILNVEHHLKSIFAYRFAEKFKNKRYAYLDINSYDPNKILSVGRLISDLSRTINFYKDKVNSPIHHYVKKYNDVPIWIMVEFLDFGKLCAMIKNSKRSIQNKICRDLMEFIQENIGNVNEHFSPEIMISFIENIHELRNVCAHNNRLLDFRCKADSKYFRPLHKKSNIEDNSSRRYAYSVFVSMQCFLSQTEFKILSNTIRKRMNLLKNHLNSIEIEEILNLLRFPSEWLAHPRLEQ
ncbi:Abi family protein [Lactobacillus johnsonii]|uniref:Abi family protein n=1 Tax=Lactobacillus johnsonii TaxID=33959 RepID=UPI003D77D0B1